MTRSMHGLINMFSNLNHISAELGIHYTIMVFRVCFFVAYREVAYISSILKARTSYAI